jgi:hypothetical protein
MVQKGYAKIRIENCSNSLWGAVAWEQTPGIDDKNPDAGKRGRPTLGMPVLLDMKPTDQNKWTGHIYNSEDGKTYSSYVSLASPDVLQVRGCFIICMGEDWTRVKEEPTLPGAPNPVAPPKAGGPTSGGSKPSGPQTMSPPKPGAAPTPPRPFDITTASVEEFCANVPLNGAPAPPPH